MAVAGVLQDSFLALTGRLGFRLVRGAQGSLFAGVVVLPVVNPLLPERNIRYLFFMS